MVFGMLRMQRNWMFETPVAVQRPWPYSLTLNFSQRRPPDRSGQRALSASVSENGENVNLSVGLTLLIPPLHRSELSFQFLQPG